MMNTENVYELAGVSLSVRSFYPHTLFPFWKWRLDPYLSRRSDERAPGVSIVCEGIPEGFGEDRVQRARTKMLDEERNGFFFHQVYRCEEGGILWQMVRAVDASVWLSWHLNADEDRLTLLEDRTNSIGMAAFNYLGMIMPMVLLKYDILTLHGVLMDYQGQGVIISAASGTGKTTHARLWRDIEHALIINGDRTVMKKEEGHWTGYGLPWSGSSGEQINRSVPIAAVVILERGTENQAKEITGIDAFRRTMPHVQYPNWDRDKAGKAIDLLSDLISQVPVIRLTCRPDEESVAVLKSALFSMKLSL